MKAAALDALKTYYGYDSFRSGQEKLIEAILDGRDVLGIMPTGAGKSICYQIPALLLDGVTIVVSPLISLMKDQVDSLNAAGIEATYINSSLSARETSERMRDVAAGHYKLLYIAPERLESEHFRAMIRRLEVPLIAVDEAHCVSQWGHDFRPSYMTIVRVLQDIDPRPVMAAFTATATDVVKDDIVERLKLREPARVTTGYARSNLAMSVVRGADKRDFVERYIREHSDQAGIIYASTRREVESVYSFVRGLGVPVGKYHAGLSEEERAETQEAFQRDDLQIIVATNAFGMGIDKSNVRYVIHNNMPKNLEAYYQEAGRAGRDGDPGECVLLFSAQDVVTQKFFIEQSEADEERKRNDYRLLNDMVQYAHTGDCLQLAIVRYFGEENGQACGTCGNCTDTRESKDVTEEAKFIFACISEMKQRFGVTLTAKVLRGANDAKIKQFNFDRLRSYGRLKHMAEKPLVQLIHALVADGYLRMSDTAYPVVQLMEPVLAVMRGEAQVYQKVEPDTPPASRSRSRGSGSGSSAPVANAELFNALRQLRKRIADAEGLPPFVIFHDATLREMCEAMPETEREMRGVKGVGAAKYEKYGRAFLELIQEHR
ncbi:DNA helicase RecQ [Cohnella sp. CIP 111063]|uniref:DNA helicase RecQ n=1 Tax=unclassified Cohnella TaxID=2636738 RepID=UPI000B8C25CE|nr:MULTISPECIES: DNA helicase RecQ [unclassified Cohnella]OXS53801.1 DNA helicase RecQ [Cohnella sp. CIP 111063]PRX62377.1 ATP-dependent DNA helicase RecQ [Cohnella sp. SGD-V74]